MKTLLCSPNPPLHFLKTSALWNTRIPIIQLKPIKFQNQKQPITPWKLNANAKGFAGSPATIKENSNGKKSDKNNENDDEEIPQVVFQRMIVRILVSVGVPMAFGLAILHIFGLVKEQQLWDLPLWLPFLTTFVTFGASTLGIAYGALSTSLDPEKKGSVFGFEEAQKNWVEMWKEDDDS